MKNNCNKDNRLWLRPYKACDATTIISWCKDEESFRKWSSDRWESYPITEADMNEKYLGNNGAISASRFPSANSVSRVLWFSDLLSPRSVI